MKGAYKIIVSKKRIKYELNINRNITIIRGNSSTGKTTLIDLIDEYMQVGSTSGIHLECPRECVVLNSATWEIYLTKYNNSIMFIDEETSDKFVFTNEFAHAVKNSSNYFVIITRKDIKSLPYSINEIYGFKRVGKKEVGDQVYNEMYRIYGEYKNKNIVKPTMVITEDSNTGYEFFKTICDKVGIKCISANGKSNINNLISNKHNNNIVLIIADGAAFGPEMNTIINKLMEHKNYLLYLPESFEWLLLKSGIFNNNELSNILENPSNHIESKDFFSWERYFTYLLEHITSQIGYIPKYNKTGKLIEFYFQPKNIEKILGQMNKIQFEQEDKQ